LFWTLVATTTLSASVEDFLAEENALINGYKYSLWRGLEEK
jgi:hypothetical protein